MHVTDFQGNGECEFSLHDATNGRAVAYANAKQGNGNDTATLSPGQTRRVFLRSANCVGEVSAARLRAEAHAQIRPCQPSAHGQPLRFGYRDAQITQICGHRRRRRHTPAEGAERRVSARLSRGGFAISEPQQTNMQPPGLNIYAESRERRMRASAAGRISGVK